MTYNILVSLYRFILVIIYYFVLQKNPVSPCYAGILLSQKEHLAREIQHSASFLTKKPDFFVAHLLEYLGATAPLRTVYCASSRLELGLFILKTTALALGTKQKQGHSIRWIPSPWKFKTPLRRGFLCIKKLDPCRGSAGVRSS